MSAYIDKLMVAAQMESIDKPFMWSNTVRAILQAMREPSEEMVSVWTGVAWPQYDSEGDSMGDEPTACFEIWQAMIDKALSE